MLLAGKLHYYEITVKIKGVHAPASTPMYVLYLILNRSSKLL